MVCVVSATFFLVAVGTARLLGACLVRTLYAERETGLFLVETKHYKFATLQNIITIRGSLLGLINKLILLGIPDKEAIVS